MNEKRRIFFLIFTMLSSTLIITSLSIFLLYQTAINEEKVRLTEIAASQARLIESVARFDEIHSQNFPGGAGEATLSQVKEAYENYEIFRGKTGEFTLARKENGYIVFLIRQQQDNHELPQPVKYDSDLAEPMRQALSGNSGTIIGLDYQGDVVLAAYEPVDILKLGIVAKIDLAEIRSPYYRAVILSFGGLLFVLAVSLFLFLRIGTPIISELHENELRFYSAFEQTTFGMLLISPDRKIILSNPHFSQIFGYSAEELKSQPLEKFFNAGEMDKNQEIMKVFVNKRGSYSAEIQCKRKDQSHCWVDLILSSVYDDSGELKFFTLVIDDINQRKELEEAQQELVEELWQKNLELEQYTSSFSHDLKGPLTSIQLFSGYLAQDMSWGNLDKAREDVTEINQAARTMNQMLVEVQQLSRIGKKNNYLKRRLHFDEVVREALEFHKLSIAENQIKVIIDPGLPFVYGNYEDLCLLMSKLIDNAIKFMGEQEYPMIHIGSNRKENDTVLFVEDNGIGILPDYHERVYKLFEKLDRDSSGVGVGLTIVKRIIDAHHGNIWIESEGKNKGSRFCFSLPENK